MKTGVPAKFRLTSKARMAPLTKTPMPKVPVIFNEPIHMFYKRVKLRKKTRNFPFVDEEILIPEKASRKRSATGGAKGIFIT